MFFHEGGSEDGFTAVAAEDLGAAGAAANEAASETKINKVSKETILFIFSPPDMP